MELGARCGPPDGWTYPYDFDPPHPHPAWLRSASDTDLLEPPPSHLGGSSTARLRARPCARGGDASLECARLQLSTARAEPGEGRATATPHGQYHRRLLRRDQKQIGGFYIIDAPNLDTALAWAAKVTDAIDTPIEVRPFMDVPNR